MYRILPETGEILVPHVFEDGKFGVADPANGRKRHHIALKVPVATIDKLREYHRRGWPVWMSIRGTRDRRLISNGIVDAPPPDGPAAPVPAREERARPASAARKEAAFPALPAAREFPVPEDKAGDVARKYLPVIAGMTEEEAERECASPSRLLMAFSANRFVCVGQASASGAQETRSGRRCPLPIAPMS